MNGLTVMETREMSMTQIEIKLGEYIKKLEELGMDHTSACAFASSIMNLGIAAQEKWNEANKKIINYILGLKDVVIVLTAITLLFIIEDFSYYLIVREINILLYENKRR